MNQRQQPPNQAATVQSYVLIMAAGFVGLLVLGLVFKKNLEF